MAKKHILVVDDERDLLKVLDYNLRREGYEVTLARTGEEGLEAAKGRHPDLIVLDLMLPRIDGLEVCRLLKADPVTRPIPVLMLTAKGTETDQVVGLEIGADDYVTKPFGVQVLLARVKKLLHRAAAGAPAAPRPVLRSRTLTLDRERQRVTVRGRDVPLTSLEFRILAFLMERPGKVFTRDEVLNGAWKHEAFVTDRTVDVHIRSIRRKLGREAGDYIETVRGTGYRFRESRP